MKKFFTLTMLLAVALTVGAQNGRTWDFTKWSSTTVSQVKDATDWTNDEKGDGTSNVVPDDACVWVVGGSVSDACDENGNLMAGGAVIPELEGLVWTNLASKKIAIAFDYQVTTDANKWGPYNGPSYLWLNGKTTAVHFTIPAVDPGTVIKMGIESHKPSEARGIDLLVGGTKLDMDPTAYPTTYQEYSWTIPGEEGGDPVDVDVQPSNGCHIYYIIVGDGGQPQPEEAKKVAYLYNGDLDSDLSYIFLSGDERFEVTPVEMTENVDYASLSEYEAVVLSPSIENPASLRSLIAFIPVVNLTASNYSALGLGINRETETNILTIADATNDIFEGLDETVEYDGAINGVILGEYFANDAVLATADGVVAIHAHNPGRNAYYLIPSENASEEAVYMTLIPQAVLAAAKTKRDVVAVGTPTISVKQEDGASVVTITATNSTKIFYTTDGNDPTEESTVYAEPFTVTEACTVKAFAIGDGYLNSEIAEKEVAIAVKAAAPEFTLSREAGKTMVTLTCATDGVDVYYNYAGQSTTTASVKYSEPFEVTTPTTVYAFANAAEGILASDLVEKFVGVDGINKDNIRWDVVAHFNANADNWSGKGQQKDDSGNIINANYFFTWGKNAGKYWDETSEQVQKTDEEGQPVYEEDGVTPVMVYTKTLEPETYEADGWLLKSIGQVMTFEKLNIGWNIGDTSMRNPDKAEDAIGVNDEEGITENALTFGKQPTDGPFNASLETTTKIAGPFDVVLYAGNGNDGEIPTMQIETSTDGENWTKLGDVAFSLIKRNWKKTVLSFDESSEVYVRLLHTAAKSGAQIYDIYVMKNGEKSQQYSEETMGVSEVKSDQRAKVVGIYSINGIRTQQLTRGLNIVVSADGSVRKVMSK